MPGGVTGNYVGETLLAIRAHQGDVRVDWSASTNDKFFGRYSFALYEDRRDDSHSRSFSPTRNDQPFHNVGFNWNRVFGSSVINELLVGYSSTTVIAETLDWAGVGAGNALYGIAGGQPIDGLSSIGWGSGLTAPGAIAPDSDTLAKTYQINEKVTWIKGRHAVKFGGQLLRYNQRRFYAGNNGLLGFINFNGDLHELRVLRLPARPWCPARAGAAATPTTRGRTCRIGPRSLFRTTSRSCET